MAMDHDSLKATLVALAKEYEDGVEESHKGARKAERAAAAIKAILALATDEPLRFDGSLADACRTVLKSTTKSMTPVETRDAIAALGYDLSQHPNPMAAIHAVLKRLAESDAVRQVSVHRKIKDGSTKELTGYLGTKRGNLVGVPPPTPRPPFQGLAELIAPLNSPELRDALFSSTEAMKKHFADLPTPGLSRSLQEMLASMKASGLLK